MNYVTHTHQYVSGGKITHTHLFEPGHWHEYLDDEDRYDGRLMADPYVALYDGYYSMAENLSVPAVQRLYSARAKRLQSGVTSMNLLAATEALKDYLSTVSANVVQSSS